MCMIINPTSQDYSYCRKKLYFNISMQYQLIYPPSATTNISYQLYAWYYTDSIQTLSSLFVYRTHDTHTLRKISADIYNLSQPLVTYLINYAYDIHLNNTHFMGLRFHFNV